eukprot:768391-Hanusia_phi.AAC.1
MLTGAHRNFRAASPLLMFLGSSQFGPKTNYDAAKPGSAPSHSNTDDYQIDWNDPSDGKGRKKMVDWLRSNKATLWGMDINEQSFDNVVNLRQEEMRRISAKQTKETFASTDMVARDVAAVTRAQVTQTQTGRVLLSAEMVTADYSRKKSILTKGDIKKPGAWGEGLYFRIFQADKEVQFELKASRVESNDDEKWLSENNVDIGICRYAGLHFLGVSENAQSPTHAKISAGIEIPVAEEN